MIPTHWIQVLKLADLSQFHLVEVEGSILVGGINKLVKRVHWISL